jgi:hypothetical protein
MNSRNIPVAQPVSKSISISITLKDGKTYQVVPDGQMQMLRDSELERMANEVNYSGESVTQEEMMRRLAAWEETLPFGTLGRILGKMTQEERELWAMKYRFEGIWHSKKND